MSSTYLTAHFTRAELACRCGCGLVPAEEFLARLDALRVVVGHPMPVTSGARCAAYNTVVAKTGPNGPHVPRPANPDYGAVDFQVAGPPALDFLRVSSDLGWFGFGLQQSGPWATRWMHIDNWPPSLLPRPALWTYSGGSGE